MEPFLNLTNAEAEIIEFLWTLDEPATLQDVIRYCTEEKQRTWKQQTIYTFLSRLEQKGVVSAVKKGQKRYYSAALTLDQLRSVSARHFIDVNFQSSLPSFLTAFAGDQGIAEEDKEALRKILKS